MNIQQPYPANSYPQMQDAMSVPVSSDELYATEIQENKIKNIIAQISPENQLQDIEMRIRGKKKNFDTGEWENINNNQKQTVSELLINRYISYLGSIMNQNTTMGNLSGYQITRLMKQMIEWITDDIDTNARLYNIESDFTERTRIGHIMLNCTFLAINRSRDGIEARRMWKTLSLTESSNPTGEQKSGLDSLKFWKK